MLLNVYVVPANRSVCMRIGRNSAPNLDIVVPLTQDSVSMMGISQFV